MTQVEQFSPRRSRRSAPSAHGPGNEAPGSSYDSGSYAGDADPDQGDRRGSHATTFGQGFSWVLAWTIIGTLIPGSGLIAAGWRRLGGLLLLLIGLGLAGLALAGLKGDVLKRALNLAFDREKLLYVTAGAALVGLIWVAVILLTHSQLRRYANLTNGQRAFSSLVVVALLVVAVLPAYKIGSTAWIQRNLISNIASDGDSQTSTAIDTQKKDPWAGIERENVLLIGSDAGKGREGTRPDTMIVASIAPQTGNTVLFSLPRNLMHARFAPGTPGAQAYPDGYYCEDHTCLLNAIWRWAEGEGHQYYAKYKNPGLRATEDAIYGTTGLKIDTWASLNLKGFQEFVDAINGVRVNVTERIPIAGNSEDGHCGMGGYITPGRNKKLNGYDALWFARSRCASDDYDRMHRQRCVIGAVVKQADPTTLVRKFPSIAAAAGSNIGTGIKESEFPAWATLALRVKNATVSSLTFDDKVLKSRINPDIDLIHRLVQQALQDSVSPQASATPDAGSTPAASSSGGTSSGSKSGSKATTTTDPDKAQNLNAVC